FITINIREAIGKAMKIVLDQIKSRECRPCLANDPGLILMSDQAEPRSHVFFVNRCVARRSHIILNGAS
ncbi:MAG TPA: hypothetical protein VK970_24785, partial [Candidatus Methylacidiphilales bacterium]|nr:hypothetical protein [Candidatus Methylacidiphilales bacterium]